MSDETRLATTVNGAPIEAVVEPRMLLSDFIRHVLGLTGTHVGCEHGVCGACTVLVDGEPARSCLMLAVQAHGAEVTTVEAVARDAETLSAVQQALGETLALQCGFCTPGIVMSLTGALEQDGADEESLLEMLGGHICRCTGYQGIRAAARLLAKQREDGGR